MEEVKIKFEKEYSVNTDDSDGEPCHCCLKLILPEDKDGKLTPILRDRSTCIFGKTLSSYWGEEWHHQISSIIITSTSWDKLSQLVDKKIKKIISQLKEVKKRNEDILNTIPKNGIFTIEI